MRRTAVIALAGTSRAGDAPARALARSLRSLGTEITYLGREDSAERIAAAAARERADTIELCLASTGGIPLLRQLLRELDEVGRREVSIVVHRVE